MEGYLVDFSISLFFLTALIFTAKSKTHISEGNSETYKYISSGLVILTLAAVSHLGFYQGLFNSIPFLSEELFYSLTYWIMNITGIILLAYGITNWLPLNNSLRKYNKIHFRHLSLLKDIEQLIAVEKRPDIIFKKSINHMVEHFDAIRGAVYMCSSVDSKMVFLGGAGTDSDQLKEIRINYDLMRKSKFEIMSSFDSSIFDLPEKMPLPEILLPVLVADKKVAVFLLWLDETFVYEDDQVVLKIAADIVGRAIKSRKDNLTLEYSKTLDNQLDHIQNLFNYKTGVRDNFTRVTKYLKSIIDIDYLSLFVAYSSKDIHRFTIGSNGTILCEKGLDQNVFKILEDMDHKREQLRIITKENTKKPYVIKSLMEESNMKTLACLSLHTEHGFLVIGSETEKALSKREKYLILRIRRVFGHYIAQEVNRFKQGMLTQRFMSANKFLGDVLLKGSVQQVFEEATRVIMKELKTALVRISTFEDEGTFLKSRAMSVVHTQDDLIPEDGYMVLSLMPTISKIKESGKPKLINQNDPDHRISMAEAGQLYFSELKTALLVPINVGNEVKGIITLADRRNGTRYQYTEEDILFVSLIAKTLSASLNLNAIDYSAKNDKYIIRRIQDSENTPELKTSIRSLLSGINGSVEMIKSHQPREDENLSQYYKIIDRNVRSINECITGNTSVVNVKEQPVEI